MYLDSHPSLPEYVEYIVYLIVILPHCHHHIQVLLITMTIDESWLIRRPLFCSFFSFLYWNWVFCFTLMYEYKDRTCKRNINIRVPFARIPNRACGCGTVSILVKVKMKVKVKVKVNVNVNVVQHDWILLASASQLHPVVTVNDG